MCRGTPCPVLRLATWQQGGTLFGYKRGHRQLQPLLHPEPSESRIAGADYEHFLSPSRRVANSHDTGPYDACADKGRAQDLALLAGWNTIS